MENIKKSTIVQISLLFGTALIFGGALGWGLSETRNIENSEYITQFDTALPTKLLDINGELITELASDEKREIISLQKLPQLMIDALLTREDRIFYEHRGFSYKAVTRAFAGKLLHIPLGGGSTLTQQIAGTLYCDRTDMTIRRKLKELWWAIQMERRCSKNEILETYLNKIYFGGGTYGVNAASKYYFGHSATDITPAEAAILVIQLSNPAYYNPFDHPNRAMERQKDVLNSMVREGYISKSEADESFDTYWADFDYTRTSSSAYLMRDDKAPWFSEYVRRELGGMIYGAEDIYTSGFTVNTTLDLNQQAAATDVMQRYIAYANRTWKREQSNRSSTAFKTYVPLSELLSLVFNLPGIKMSKERSRQIANDTFVSRINPILDVYSMMFGLENLKVGIVNKANSISMQKDEKTTIEGTMITLQNDTGYITALVGGSKYDQDNQLIRAVQSRLQPGSTFKPLYYSAAIDSRKFTPSTEISDTPVVFHKSDGTPYIPQNFKGEWKGNVQLWYALAHSMNVPSLKVLDGIGFDAAIERTSTLLGIPQNELAERHFLPVYPLGLGVCSVRPVEMARAFAIFANSGKEVTPMAIRTVEDRNGNVVLNPELDIRKAQQAKGSAIQIISPQTAYVMTQMLENTVQSGTLAGQGAQLTYKNDKGRTYTIPLAGKTGTTQNWADAWTVAFSPYYTAAFWFGFDKPGNSLGLHITGATLAGIAMGEFMGKIHKDLPYKDFAMPATGVVKVTVCSESGLLPTQECPTTTQWFLAGTEPTEVCPLHSNSSSTALFYDRLEKEMYKSGQRFTDEVNTSPLSLDLNFLNDNTPQHKNEQQTEHKQDENTPDYNYLMD
ncbi:MAG: PBP1A family penicillin-binding protein [Treponema sp.]